MRDQEDTEQTLSHLPHFHRTDDVQFEEPDFLDWYIIKSMEIEDRLTDEEIDQLSSGFCEGHDEFQKMLLSLVNKEHDCPGVRGEVQTQFSENWRAKVNVGGEIYYDIRVRGLTADSYDSVTLTYHDTDVCNGVWNPQTHEIEFPDFTQDNPLFLPHNFASVKISFGEQNPTVQADQVTLVQRVVFLNIDPRNILLKSQPISRVPSEQKYLLANHWQAIIFDYDELVLVYPDGHQERWQQDNDTDDEFDDELGDHDDLEPMTVQI